MLNVNNLAVKYGYIDAVNGISFHVNKGEIVTLIGSNGAGKTTTLGAITGLVPKVSGVVLFNEQDISRMPTHLITRTGLAHVPEGRKIFPDLTVEENLIVSTVYQSRVTEKDVKTQMARVYELFPRLFERKKQGGGTLSGGEQQMLAIGRGLMVNPELLILDEPSLGLSPLLVEEIFTLIEKINEEGVTILLVEQNASMALSIANRGYVLETGHITLEGPGMELMTNEDIRKAYLGA